MHLLLKRYGEVLKVREIIYDTKKRWGWDYIIKDAKEDLDKYISNISGGKKSKCNLT